jgi:hypothetical protein
VTLDEDSEEVVKAKEAIDAVFGDTSVPQEETLDRLKEVRSHIDVLMDAIRTDLKRQ